MTDTPTTPAPVDMVELPPPAAEARCLNCGQPLGGVFCSSCGQRDIPADPTVHEFVDDAWRELSGYDGRIAATVRALMHPGRLTREFVAGHRARYISPVRLYLTASLLYFVTAAASPDMSMAMRSEAGISAGGLQISAGRVDLSTPEAREQFLASVERAPALLRPVLRAVVQDPSGLRARVLEVMPRVFFAMLPVFAAIVALFFRGRSFPTHLTFAAHVHAFAFLVLSLTQVVEFTRLPVLVGVLGVATVVAASAYAVMAMRVVYQQPWRRTLPKAAGVGALYAVAAVPAMVVIVAWALVG